MTSAVRGTKLIVVAVLAVLALVSGCAGQPEQQAARPSRSAASAGPEARTRTPAPAASAPAGGEGSYRTAERQVTFTEPARTGPADQYLGRRTLVTQLWYPRARGPAGPFPLLLFAPGFLQCPGAYSDLRVHQLLSPHVFIGVVLIPPVLLKVASTTWRFARYYTGAPAYRRKGAPPVLLRLLGPVVVILTLVLLFSGAGLLMVSRPWLSLLLKVHKASFVLWFGAMTIHVLGHLGEVFRLAPRDWLRRTRREVTGAGTRQWLIAASLVAGVMLGFLLLSHVGHWLSAAPGAGQ